MVSLAPAPDDFAPCAYPEGVWRMPLGLVLASSRSAYVREIRNRQALGLVEDPAVVWKQSGLYFAQVRLQAVHRDARAVGARVALVIQLHDWDASSVQLAPIFGKRKAAP